MAVRSRTATAHGAQPAPAVAPPREAAARGAEPGFATAPPRAAAVPVQVSRTPASRGHPRALTAGVREAPRHEIALSGQRRLQQALWGFGRSRRCWDGALGSRIGWQRRAAGHWRTAGRAERASRRWPAVVVSQE